MADMRQTNTNEVEKGSTTIPQRANYAGSPGELSIRLHEVLESPNLSNIPEIKSKQTQNNHKSGDALEAFYEACNEFAKLDGSDETQNGGGTSRDDKDFDEDEMEKL